MSTCFLAPDPLQGQFFIPTGGGNVPGNGVQLFLFANLSTTPQAAFKDPLGVTAWTHPIVLDSTGNLPSGAEIWFVQGQTYTAVYAPSNDVSPPASPYRTLNNLTGMNDASFVQSQWAAAPTPSFVSASSFTVAGDQTAADLADVGRRMKFTVTAGTVWGTILSRSFGAGVTTIVLDMDGAQALDAGLSAASYSLLTATNDAVPLLPGGRAIFMDPTAPTKQAGLDLSLITVSTVPFYTLPNTSGTMVLVSSAATLFNKTLISPVLNTSVSGGALASKAQEIVGTSNALLVTPSVQNFHPSAAQAWAAADTNGNITASYNVLSVTDIGIGVIGFNWASSFASANYAVMGMAMSASTATVQAMQTFINNQLPPTISTATLQFLRSSGAAQANIDPNNWTIVAFGALA